ncbi:protein FLX-like 1 [Hordeum vulgare]|nr:protein FLX-like 1 [Hordeum vulgare]
MQIKQKEGNISNVDYALYTNLAGYAGSYGNPNANYAANPYYVGYSMNQANATDSGSQYGAGAAHSFWGAYDMQRAAGRR